MLPSACWLRRLRAIEGALQDGGSPFTWASASPEDSGSGEPPMPWWLGVSEE